MRAALAFVVLVACSDPEPAFHSTTSRAARPATASTAPSDDATAACRRGDLARCLEICGTAADCVNLGLAREPTDAPLALQLYLAGCEGDVLEGCGNAADMLRGTDLPRARALATRACDGDVGVGCQNLGVIRQEEDGDLAGAAEAYRRGCELGSAMSCTATAALRAAGLETITAEEEIALARRGCDGGDGVGCANLGRTLIRGIDAPAAREAFARACELEYPSGCYDLALSLGRGEGGPVDLAGATAAAQRGCALGSESACSLFAPE